MDFLALYELKHRGMEAVSKTLYDVPEKAVSLVEKMSLSFYERLNSVFLNTIPQELREYYLDRLSAADIIPYTENDWKEFRMIRAFLAEYHPGIIN